MVGKLKCFACRESNDPKYPFPISDKETLKKWLKYLNIKGRIPKKNSRLCENHFNLREVLQKNPFKSFFSNVSDINFLLSIIPDQPGDSVR